MMRRYSRPRHFTAGDDGGEHEFVKIDLQLRFTDTVIRADQSLLQIADRRISEWVDRNSTAPEFGSRCLVARDMPHSGRRQSVDAFIAVGVHCRTRRDVLLHKRVGRRFFQVLAAPPFDAGPTIPAVFDRNEDQWRIATVQLTAAARTRRMPHDPVSSISARLCSNIQAVPYRRKPSCRCKRSAD